MVKGLTTTARGTRFSSLLRAAAVACACLAAAAHGAPGQSLDLELSTDLVPAERAGGAPSARPQSPGAYRIGAGDKVSIVVFGEPDLTVREVNVKRDGVVAFPLIGELQVVGLTSQELQELVTRRLADGYLKRPSVSVTIDQFRLYYIKGEVRRPGGYSFVEGLTVEKAVAMAGGFTERASKNHITLVRESDADAPAEKVIPGTAVLPGDVITVGESFF